MKRFFRIDANQTEQEGETTTDWLQSDGTNLFLNNKSLFDLMYPVGISYVQYPGFVGPNELWGNFSKWENIDYGGAFFRSGKNKNISVETSIQPSILGSNGVSINVKLPESVENDENNTVDIFVGNFIITFDKNTDFKNNHKVRLSVNDDMYNANFNHVKDFVELVIGKEYDHEEYNETLENCYIMQQDAMQGHKHNDSRHSHKYYDLNDAAGLWGQEENNGRHLQDNYRTTETGYANIGLPTKYDDNYGVPRISTETRPKNFTYQIWKRIK